jgi:hypothetical protein
MTTAAMRERWPKDHAITPHLNSSRWFSLSERCRVASRQRGSIAHLTGAQVDADKPHKKTISVLVEPPLDPRHPQTWGEAKSKGVSVRKLNYFRDEWKTLVRDLAVFSIVLWDAVLAEASSLQLTGQHHPSRTRRPRKTKELRSPSEPSQG